MYAFMRSWLELVRGARSWKQNTRSGVCSAPGRCNKVAEVWTCTVGRRSDKLRIKHDEDFEHMLEHVSF